VTEPQYYKSLIRHVVDCVGQFARLEIREAEGGKSPFTGPVGAAWNAKWQRMFAVCAGIHRLVEQQAKRDALAARRSERGDS